MGSLLPIHVQRRTQIPTLHSRPLVTTRSILPLYHTGLRLPSLATVYDLGGGIMDSLRRIDDDDTFELVSHSQTDKIRMLFSYLYLTAS